MNLDDVFEFVGTPEQNTIARAALERTTYPWLRLKPGLRDRVNKERIPIEWADLSRYARDANEERAYEDNLHDHHEGDYDLLEYRHRVLGLAWYSGKVSIEQSLVSEPELAGEVLLAEGAHMIDFFALTPEQRRRIWELAHEGGEEETAEHDATHGWFDTPFSSWTGGVE